MSNLTNKEIRERISKLHSKKENLIGRKEELLESIELLRALSYTLN